MDATILNNKMGFGVIIRDCDGFVIGGGGGFKDEFMTTEWANLYAFEKGIKLVQSLNVENAIFEADCTNLVNRFKKCKDDITIIVYRTNEIHKTMELFTKVEVKWANQSCNEVIRDIVIQFSGKVEDNPKKAEFWLENTIKVFDELSCFSNECLKCVVSLLKDETYQWWNTLTAIIPKDHLSWEFFQTEVKKKNISVNDISIKREKTSLNWSKVIEL
ncbi:zf-CCHC domain-containing protein/RVP_2 domain-containing protein [Gossypium australe]|uniref:Zf-CCHC domain-containing protein/RVP_2 domain-containing protein n=1 Tax=Gossypium australe TaxID=47621 RepID=A0A5B6VN77_9ROSI|nr:zf-CCHC domain-containing protein/RVP_2 domain-containing protein [Gossypium australe]